MEDKTHNFWNIIVSVVGVIVTAASILIGFSQFNRQQEQNMDMELKKNFWTIQNQLYTEICNNAGAMAASIEDAKQFNIEKTKFLTHYYGQMVLVEDKTVEESMIAVKSYLEVFEPEDPNMRNILKRKILNLSGSCKNSSLTFKRKDLE